MLGAVDWIMDEGVLGNAWAWLGESISVADANTLMLLCAYFP